jgi:hypothetical protein
VLQKSTGLSGAGLVHQSSHQQGGVEVVALQRENSVTGRFAKLLNELNAIG